MGGKITGYIGILIPLNNTVHRHATTRKTFRMRERVHGRCDWTEVSGWAESPPRQHHPRANIAHEERG